jgi:dihydroxyacetone kinase-like protein
LTSFDAATFLAFLRDGLAAVQARGKAKPGDKTMLDALFPALQAAQAYEQQGLLPAVEAAAKAAGQGAESTKSMLASVGRAKTLGPRALGFIDPGALSTSLILSSMAQYVKSLRS